MILYTCAGSRGLRVSWAAEELGISLDLRMLPFPPRAFAREFLEVNPLGTVPALVDGDVMMTESSAILQYLVAKAAPTPLAIAPDEADFGAYLDYLHYADATITFPQTVYLRFAIFEKERGLQEAGEAYGDWFGKRLRKLEARLAGRDFLCGGRFTVADIAVGYALYLSTRNGLSHHLTPAISAYLERLMARPGFTQATAREKAAAKAVGIGAAI
jgi:glutathione S-transferase